MVQLVQGTVDTQKNICRSIGRANAGDDLELELEVKMNEQPVTFVNPICELLMKKSDNNKVRQTNGILYQDGKFKIKVDEQGVTFPGIVTCQLVVNDEGRVSTCLFYFTVGASLEKEILQSISKVETLEQLDSYVVAAFSNLDEYEKRLTLLDSTMTTTNEEITINESERKSNESERKDNETLRIENEKERVKKENEMSAAEIDRKENELDRIKNENARRIAENTRIARENARENAEINRNAIFEENEAIRTEAEKLRVQAEIKRKESFSNLESLNEKLNAAEENRVNSEEDRISKETERQLAEAERERAEANREKIYTSFNDAEVDRKNSENNRIQAEASRVQAENARSEQFEAAQSARETKFQEVENNRDKLFKANETARATEEIARGKAESTREGNEAIRVNNESLRVAAEKARQQEEIKRGQSEVARVEAEEVRELSYEAIKKDNSIFKQQINEDFGNAKTDYFGKEHNNIVERLNSDFDNIYQKINKSNFLEYKGSNITATNSLYGYTKELNVKGRTLQNLITFKSKTYNNDYPNIVCTRNIDLKPNTTYTFITPYFDNQISMYIGFNGNYDNQILGYQHKNIGTFTTKADIVNVGSYIIFYYLGSNAKSFVEACLTTHMILEGDYTNIDFDIPYIEGIKSVGENEVTEEGKYPVNIKSCGKNLFDFDRVATDLTNKNTRTSEKIDGGYKFKALDYTGKHNRSTLKLKPNTSYKVTFTLKKDEGGTLNFGIYTTANSNSSAFYITSDGTYTRSFRTNSSGIIQIRMDCAIGIYSYYTNIQIEEGTIATDYEPYQESIQEILLDEPLRSLPNGVCDEITEDGTEIRRVVKLVMNNETCKRFSIWNNTNASRNYIRFYIYYKDLLGGTIGIHNSRSFNDRFNAEGSPYGAEYESCNTVNNYIGASIKVDRIPNFYNMTLEQQTNSLLQWLKENPITIYYQALEPTIIKHNKNINLKTYAGTTHITSTNVLPATINCKVPSNVQAVISNLKEENEALNTQVLTLNLENADIKETNIIQDELINTTMMATDEMYMMLEPLLAETLSERSVSKMVDMYVAMVQRGIKTIEQVPVRYREQVKKILDQLEK